MKTYKANFKANNGTRFMNPIEGTNLKKIIKDIREIAEGERFEGNECSWWVYTEEDGRDTAVAAGGMMSDGTRYRIPDHSLCQFF